jgi:hypothetical protein
MKTRVVFATIVAGLAGAAHAQSGAYTVVYTDQISDTIGAVTHTGATSTLVDFRSFQSDAATRLAWLTPGPDGALYVANAPFPVSNPSSAAIYRVGNIWGTPSVSVFASSDPIQNPVGITYDAARSQFLTLNNAAGPIAQGGFDGVLGLANPSGAKNVLFTEGPNTGPRPRYEAGHHVIPDTTTGNFIISCVNGGSFAPVNSDPDGSTLWYFNAASNTVSLLADLSFSLPGGESITFATGMAMANGDNDLFVSNSRPNAGEGAIYRVIRDDVSGAVTGVNLVLGGLTQPEQLLYNPYNGKLIVNERGNYDGATPGVARIFEMNLDGTNVTTLATGMHARGLYVVPAPGSLALLGLGTLIATRRRR